MDKIIKKIREMEKCIKPPKKTSSYRQIIKSVFILWKQHHSIAQKCNIIKKQFENLHKKHKRILDQLTEKSKHIQQIKDDFGLVYSNGKYIKK